MREIKFRGKHISGKWLYGSYIKERQLSFEMGIAKEYITSSIYTKTNDGCIAPYHKVPVMPNTIGQYTGLKDKNGNEIYEGDIVEATCKYKGNVEFHNVGIVKYIESGFVICIDDDDEFDFPLYNCISNDERQDIFVVIGNIYDNPELLEEQSEA